MSNACLQLYAAGEACASLHAAVPSQGQALALLLPFNCALECLQSEGVAGEGGVQGPGHSPAAVQGSSAEPAYKKTKLAHLRIKLPGGVRLGPPPLDLLPCCSLQPHLLPCCPSQWPAFRKQGEAHLKHEWVLAPQLVNTTRPCACGHLLGQRHWSALAARGHAAAWCLSGISCSMLCQS